MTMIGVAQADFHVAELEYNRELIGTLLAEADRQAVDVLLLPELANSGYTFENQAEADACAEPVPGGPVCQLLADWSRGGAGSAGRLVASGICEAVEGGLHNSAVVFGGGELLSCYRKAHLFLNEQKYFRPGSAEPPVVSINGLRVGIMICFDWFFPEMARVLALNGAQLILHPSNLVLPYAQNAMLTRSIENRVFTATANRCGLERGLRFSGLSQITSPQGERLAQVGETFNGVATAEVDLTQADNKWITPLNHLFDNRRPDLYGRLMG